MPESTGSTQEPTPNPAGREDAAVLIGWAAILEGAIMTGDLPDDLAVKVSRRLIDTGLLVEQASERELRQAINDLNHRLRYTLGEYPEPVEQTAVPE
ncbi:MAG TPA: hypothetical protein VGH43_03200 [Jatrophihabitans sp.]|jgi:hypothetical protein